MVYTGWALVISGGDKPPFSAGFGGFSRVGFFPNDSRYFPIAPASGWKIYNFAAR